MSDSRAHAEVSRAVRSGTLPPVTSQRCFDCGAVATAYDHHMGYARKNWLDVQPVCARHNVLRSKTRRTSTHGARDPVAVLMRIPSYLIDALDAEARAEHRSRTQQLNWILRDRYSDAQSITSPVAISQGEESDDWNIRELGGPYIRSAA